jgi:transposase, IS30 family
LSSGTSRYVLLVPLPDGRTAAEVRAALTRAVIRLPDDLRRTLTWDRGKEMAAHDLRTYTRAALDAVARQLNNRPRQTLGW